MNSVVDETNNFDVLPTEIKLSNHLEKDSTNIANAFNNYFVNIDPNLASKISLTAQSSYMKYLYENHNQAMFIVPVDEYENSVIIRIKIKAQVMMNLIF